MGRWPLHAMEFLQVHQAKALSPETCRFSAMRLRGGLTKVVEGALTPMKEHSIHILAYLDNWLIRAQSQEMLCEHRNLVLRHLAHLGLWVNWEKSKLCPMQIISFLGMELDLIELTTHLTKGCVQLVLNCLNVFYGKIGVPLKLFPRLLGHMAASFTPWPDPSFLVEWCTPTAPARDPNCPGTSTASSCGQYIFHLTDSKARFKAKMSYSAQTVLETTTKVVCALLACHN